MALEKECTILSDQKDTDSFSENEITLPMSSGNGVPQRRFINTRPDSKLAELFLRNIRSNKMKPFDQPEAEQIMQNVITPAFDMIEARATHFVTHINKKVHKKFAHLKINELGRWFYLRIEITRYRCVILTAEFAVSYKERSSQRGDFLAKEIIDCRQGSEIQIADVVDFFNEIYIQRHKLSDEIIRRQQQEEELDQEVFLAEKKLLLEKIRRDYLKLRLENNELNEDQMATTYIDRIFREFFKIY